MSNIAHELTILYLQKQDISNLTPKELYCKYIKYINTYTQIAECQKANKTTGMTVLK